MIVLDEQIGSADLARKIAAWYPGRVAILKVLRSDSVIKDDAADMLLRQGAEPTFVTINVKDIWHVIRPDARFAIVNMDLPLNRAREVSAWLREFLNLAEFDTKAKRMGIIALIHPTQIEFYRLNRKVEIIERTPR